MRLAAVLSFASFAGAAAVACNFIVDAQFSGKTFPGQDGATPCPLGNMPQDLGCYNCVASVCKAEFAAMCKDGDKAVGKSYLNACVDDPDVAQGQCERIFIDAGQGTAPNDPPGHWYDMQVCVTQKCKQQCTTCSGLTYPRSPDNVDTPLTPSTSKCAACLLGKCTGALIDKGTQFGHCCYQARVDSTWGPCARPSGADCSGIKDGVDAGGTDCEYKLSKCAVDNCKTDCNL
jgi:hypothetical protein